MVHQGDQDMGEAEPARAAGAGNNENRGENSLSHQWYISGSVGSVCFAHPGPHVLEGVIFGHIVYQSVAFTHISI